MNLSLLFPAGLVALTALLLPLLLHLQRRPEARPTHFAALRWLSEKLRPRQRLQLDEWLLLALRLLLVACVALLFAQPVWTARGEGKPWVLVSTQLDATQLRALQSAGTASLSSYPPDAQWHWLAPGFPAFETAMPPARQPAASLLREADAQLPPQAALIVLLPEVLDGWDGERARLARAVDWRIVPGAPPPAAPTPVQRPGLVAIRVAATGNRALRYVRAAALAGGHALDVGDADKAIPAQAQALVWLTPGTVPASVRAWTEKGGLLLLDANARWAGPDAGRPIWTSEEGVVLMRALPSGRGRILQWQRALEPAQVPALLDPAFAARFESWLQPSSAAPARASARALQPLTGARKYPRAPSPLDAVLAWAALLLFAAERWFATRAARGVPA